MNPLIQSILAQLCVAFPFLSVLLGVKGQFVRLTWSRPMKVRKGFDLSLTKEVSATVTIGKRYDARECVQAARESGELPSENQGLPWGEWLLFPYLIAHKGNHYLRVYPTENASVQVSYYIDGAQVSRETAQEFALASEFSESKPTDCFPIRLDYVRGWKYAGQGSVT